ncbi:MAG TPA: HAMP domain-containing sensor histidine kinase [Vicinamibacterales bacterium]|nr:HAMP domain-containing sensor histidine kinase [Vicinamibacterales bacterium]
MIGRVIGSLSLRARLTIWYSLALLAVLGTFATIVIWQQGRIGMRRVDRELDNLAATLANVFRDELNETSNPRKAATEVQGTMAVPGRAVAIIDETGAPLAANWHGLTLGSPIAARDEPQVWTAGSPGGPWRVHLQPMSTGDRLFFLLTAAPLTDVLREQREAKEAMWVGIPIALLLAAAGGLWLASVGLRPITDMARRAEGLVPGGMEDLGQSDRADELGQLARAFNGLVERLRQTLRTQRQFMADASHELRTPVSVIQSTSDVMLAVESRTDAEYREALSGVGSEARRLGRLVDDMLVLARADAGGYPLRRENVYLNELVVDCRRTVEVLARKRDVTVGTVAAADVPFFGDESLLRRMILNLLQNAVAYTRAGSSVVVDVSPQDHHAFIRVTDEGEGIPDPDRERIFDRFVQLDSARRSAGVGLGLPIARWIAEAHGGTLELERSSATGSTFRIVLPLNA